MSISPIHSERNISTRNVSTSTDDLNVFENNKGLLDYETISGQTSRFPALWAGNPLDYPLYSDNLSNKRTFDIINNEYNSLALLDESLAVDYSHDYHDFNNDFIHNSSLKCGSLLPLFFPPKEEKIKNWAGNMEVRPEIGLPYPTLSNYLNDDVSKRIKFDFPENLFPEIEL